MDASATPPRRSPCAVANSLDLFGDRWTLLVVRDLYCGRSRFKELAASPERIPTNILSDRLARLRRHGMVERVTPPDGSKHLAYQLTPKGESLLPLLAAVRDWGLKWIPKTRAMAANCSEDPKGIKDARPNSEL